MNVPVVVCFQDAEGEEEEEEEAPRTQMTPARGALTMHLMLSTYTGADSSGDSFAY